MGSSDYYTGNVPIKYIPLVYAILIMATCVANYIICQKNDTCYPFPYSTITNCSTMYPNNVLFRFFLLLPSFSAFVIFGVYYSWLNYQSQKLLLGKFESPIAIKQLGYLGIPFFWLAVCTIDQGKMNDTLHIIGAVTFFALWAFACWLMFFTLLKIFTRNPLVTSYYSIGIKLVVVVYQFIYVVQAIIALFQPKDPNSEAVSAEVNSEKYSHLNKVGIYGINSPNVDPNNKYEVYIEWGTMFSCLIFIATMYIDLSKVYMSLDVNYNYVFAEIQQKQEKLQSKLVKFEQKRKEKIEQEEQSIRLTQIKQQQQLQQGSFSQLNTSTNSLNMQPVYQQPLQYQQINQQQQQLSQQQQFQQQQQQPQFIYVQPQQDSSRQRAGVVQSPQIYQGIQLQQF
ncbi:hypothetical protein PPERSA_12576 [Pseudocohnilembus persalinus]|uniref:CWH43-like N-terminal domain-containing protein n=1 Tax=Pseudocohnilembus persalinus TaxID=266149 RepID=A0A0V0QCC3_PSEPJ|nr:hypothetical protein PPERSA_12576 [Pseudocohnilembus persalinus]|eukprot:KRW99900.1 hypothetical protein PPERSA_12576 [Pseudocohnilembus persalinus]